MWKSNRSLFLFYAVLPAPSMMLEANSEIGIISQSLGHMSLRTIEIYLGRISVSKIDRASDNMLNNLVRSSSTRQRSKNKVMALRDNRQEMQEAHFLDCL